MDGFDRLYELHGLLAARRGPISTRELLQRLECSRPTLQRTVQHLRDYLGAPIHNRPGEGYFYDPSEGPAFDLPGLWFTADELRALIVMRHLIASIEPGVLSEHLAPFATRIEALVHRAAPGTRDFPIERVRVLQSHGRAPSDKWFRRIANALAEARRVRIRYLGRARNRVSDREVSPQRLVYYRDNWYMDAWCHAAEALRTFSVDRVQDLESVDTPAMAISDRDLDDHLASSYGIFAGRPRRTALLRFSAERARWVADEQWHPAQSGQFTTDGRYELAVPYGDPTELVGDILRQGAEVEVLEPAELRDRIRAEIEKMKAGYG
jgi:proteasome accessory factor C